MSFETPVIIGLSAVLVTVHQDAPRVFVVHGADHGVFDANPGKADTADYALPFAFDPDQHDTLELGLRAWVDEQTPLNPGYVEQLYTFGNKGRYLYSRMGEKASGPRVISVGYLALTHYDDSDDQAGPDHVWSDWYDYFPWEDWRQGRPVMLDRFILPRLKAWADDAQDQEERQVRHQRISICFGDADLAWDNEKVLERYELLYSARLVFEACRDKQLPADDVAQSVPMQFDHRRILATAIGRVRGKLKYRPVVFEMMGDDFTLLELQRTVEALSGHNLHKQNFRRFVENSGMVEETGETTKRGGGRPANLFRFRAGVVMERAASGVKLSPAG